MARIAGVDLPRQKQIVYALPYLFGIGRAAARRICALTGVAPTKSTEELTESDIKKIRDVLDADYKVEGDLRREVQADIRRKVDIGCYQGIRHRRGLPVHGQRTQTNARTRKGKKKTVAGRKKAGKK